MHNAIYGLKALRALEERATRAGIDLMARAALACANWVAERYQPGSHILVAVGPGNNGGDALLAAVRLQEVGFKVEVLLPVPPKSPETIAAQARWRALNTLTHTQLPQTYPAPDLVIDGLFGIGMARDFSPEWSARIAELNRLGAPILALDTPTGLDPYLGQSRNAVIRATDTLTFLCHKPGLFMGSGADLAGEVFLADLDYADWGDSQAQGALNFPNATGLARHADSHKGSYGSVAIVGGACGMLGAALLAGRSALSGGAGKVFVCALDERLGVDPLAPELMIRPAGTLPDCSVLAIGPGLGQEDSAARLLATVLARPEALVIDADALNLLARDPALATHLAQRTAPAILTPHPAEAARLLAASTAEVQADRIQAARALAERLNAIVILKGAGSLIMRPDGYYHVNTSGGPALSSAGQGDVLTGLVAALLAQGLDGFQAASLAVHAHGLAGDDYARESGGPIGLSASATATRVASVLNRLLSRPGAAPRAQPD